MSADIYTGKRSMLSGETIVILALSRFDAAVQSTSYTIAQELAKNNQVYYIDNPFTINEYLKQKNTPACKLRKPFFSWFSDGLLDAGNPALKVIVTPIILSLHFLPEGKLYRKLLKLNEWIVAKRIQKVFDKESITRFIYINSADFHFPNLTNYFKPILKVYHCVDPVFTGFDRKHGLISEPELIKNTDLVICTSKQLEEEKKQLNSNTFFIPNAADVTHSSKALAEDLPVHASLKNIKKPVIGYFGNIERRIDYHLIKEVSETHPEMSFVFAGPVIPVDVPEWFYHQPNLHLTGALPYEDMPALFKGFDVAIIPFKKDEVSRTIFPLKLFEYLGAGKPVVAINFNPDLEEFTGDAVSFCEDASSFSAAIEQELAGNSPQKTAKRIAVAQENTWVKRAQEISELLAKQIKSR
jgi:teichuronic acid biosynthesis glycosyltransferase TuaH